MVRNFEMKNIISVYSVAVSTNDLVIVCGLLRHRKTNVRDHHSCRRGVIECNITY